MNKLGEMYEWVIYSSSKSFGSKPNLVRFSSLSGKEGFTSLYSVTLETANAIRQAGTTAGFKGTVWSERLWLDVDSYEEAEKVERKLYEMELDFVGYDSGGKGAHFGILRSNPPSHLLPSQDRSWATTHFPQCDSSIYTHLHLFRLPGTLHEGSGRYKELVTEHKGGALSVPSVEFALKSSQSFESVKLDESVFDNLKVMANTVPEFNGQRHARLVKLAYALKEKNVSIDIAYWWLSETNKMFEESKTDECIEQIVRSIFK
jgi:hypothetical protein